MVVINLFPLSRVRSWDNVKFNKDIGLSGFPSLKFSFSPFYFFNFSKSVKITKFIAFKFFRDYKTASANFFSFRDFSVRNYVFISRIYLKGLGYRFLRPKLKHGSRVIRAELGFSVINYIAIPVGIKVTGVKNKFMVIGGNKRLLKLFVNRLYSLSPEDIYKGKGVRTSLVSTKVFKSGKQRLRLETLLDFFLKIFFNLRN